MCDMDDVAKLMRVRSVVSVLSDVDVCANERAVYDYLKKLDDQCCTYCRFYAFKTQPVHLDVDQVDVQIEHRVLESCNLVGVDISKLERSSNGAFLIDYGEVKLRCRSDPYLLLNRTQTKIDLMYVDDAEPIEDIASTIVEFGARDKINADSMMELIRLGLPMDRAEFLHPGMIAKYKADLDRILLRVIPVKDLVWLIKSYLQLGEVPSP